MSEEREIHRSEWEGLSPQELSEPERQFLLKVKDDFIKNSSCCHLEDTASEIIENLDKEERKNYQGLNDNLSAYFEILLGSEEWEKLREFEGKRILDFDKHKDEGVG